MQTVTNIAAYQFADLKDLKPLRERLIDGCKLWKLKGTILLSAEGINLFVAGERTGVDRLLAELRNVAGLERLEPKYSESREQPFQRMLVKIKREIIAFGVEGIDPVRKPAPKISSAELKRWLDEGQPVTLLDTRNDYEVKLGTFRHALHLGIDHFRDFPKAAQKLPESLKKEPVVMFCTGGIRCEKAGPYLQNEGFENVFQLDGGILKYFEDCGGSHYDGECFVFDQRVGVDPSLHESETSQCYVCQSPLSPEDCRDDRYVEGQSCPHCFVDSEMQLAQKLAERHESIRRITTPLPGSQPTENHRPLNVPAKFDRHTVLDFLVGVLNQIPRDEWIRICNSGHLLKREGTARLSDTNLNSLHPVAADHIVRAGERYLHVQSLSREPDVNPDLRILHEDQAIIVVHKPAPLPMHPCGRYHRNTLQYILSEIYRPQSPRPAHRLDANTSGIVLFARTRHFAKVLQSQFDRDQDTIVRKRYLARVQGHPTEDRFVCELPISDQAGVLGSRCVDLENGLAARTEFRVISRFSDETSLVEAVPITGRTNQIRVHLWQLGHSICHDPTYLPDRQIGQTMTSDVNDPSMCLLAQSIEFIHPLSGRPVRFESELPDWCR